MPKGSKKALTKTNTRRVNKSAWIRSQPASLSAQEVVSKAKKEGIKLTAAQIYTARSSAKRRAVDSYAPTTGGKRGPGRPKDTDSKAVSGDLRREFMVLAVRLGADEAKRLLDRIAAAQRGN